MSFMSLPSSFRPESIPAPMQDFAESVKSFWTPFFQPFNAHLQDPAQVWQQATEQATQWFQPWLQWTSSLATLTPFTPVFDVEKAQFTVVQSDVVAQRSQAEFKADTEAEGKAPGLVQRKAAPKVAKVAKVALRSVKAASGAVVTPIKRAAAQRAKTVTLVNAKPDDLTRIEGIGPKIAQKLREAGISHFSTLAATSKSTLQTILEAAGPRFMLARPDTWAEQAKLLAAGKESAFEALTAKLRGGLRA